MKILKCPVCEKALEYHEKTWVCERNHRFDVARQGHVNLLMSQVSKSKQHGDEKQMVISRNAFLDQGYYDVFKVTLHQIIEKFNPTVVLDAGCGEGYYSQGLESRCDIIGIDISKDAIARAAKRNEKMTAVVASTYAIPIMSDSVDLVFSVFAPYSTDEVHRVLKDEGIFVEVFPLEAHLIEMKECLYPSAYRNPVILKELQGFEMIENTRVEDRILLRNQEDIQNLFTMTPYYHRTPKQGVENLSKCETLETSIGFGFAVYRKL